jgi:GTPase SAR1 family protein
VLFTQETMCMFVRMRQSSYAWRPSCTWGLLQVSTDDAQAYADENGLVYWETSAKTNANVSELFEDIAKRCASAATILLC